MGQTLIEWTWRRVARESLTISQLQFALDIGAVVDGTEVVLPGFTFNPWIGCTKVSPGCLHCYAADLDLRRFSKTLGGASKVNPIVHFGKGAPRHRTSEATWANPLKWNRQAQELGVRLRVFCASLSDWLDDEVPLEWLADLLCTIKACQHLDWILVTKRPENWRPRMEAIADGVFECAPRWFARDWLNGEAPCNAWILTTTEDQERADRRIPSLVQIPAIVRGLSCEPMLGAIDLRPWFGYFNTIAGTDTVTNRRSINWVICGGESGDDVKSPDGKVISRIRHMHPDWARSLRDQCGEFEVPFFFKQWGEFLPEERPGTECELSRLQAHQSAGWGDGRTNHVVFSRVGKAAAGKILDGREHHETPCTEAAA